MGKETIYVVGHKNPDTDSICSAIAYARLRQRQGMDQVQAARAGNINRQTEFVLDELALPVPPLLLDVHPRVKDVVGDHVVSVSAETPLSRALELFHLHNIRLLPVLDDDRKPMGILFLKKVSERFMVPRQEKEIRRVQTSPQALANCLKGTLLTSFDVDALEELNLYVGAMASETFQGKVAGIDPRSMILITGDRENIQREAIEMGVRVLIITGSLQVAPDIVARAEEQQVSILSTSFDTATSAWLSRLSTPVSALVNEDFQSVGLQERVDDLRLKMLHSKDPGVVVVDKDGRVAAVATKSNLLEPSPVKLILVDHNELSQAVAGADRVEILEVIDHHRLGNFHTDQPIRFINQPLGSTCTLVATLYRQAGIEPDRIYAALMLAGMMSDTVILKSPTTTQIDREMATWLGRLAGLDPAEFGRRIFGAGSALAAYPTTRALVLGDFKEYTAGDQSFGVGQVEVVNFQEFFNLKGKIQDELAKIREERGLHTAALLVTDIVQETSLLLAFGGKELPYVIGYPQLEDNLFELKGVLSRKKQLVPHLLKVLKG